MFFAGDRGFEYLVHPTYPPGNPRAANERLASQSPIVGDYEDSLERPGTSALRIGDNHHLGREEVSQLVEHPTYWLETGSFVSEGHSNPPS